MGRRGTDRRRIQCSATRVLTPRRVGAFRRSIYGHFRRHGRSFPWRSTRDPYRILISEIMLQQTQAARVEKHYREFIA